MTEIKRNQTCPCLSGKKFKNCCLKTNENPAIVGMQVSKLIEIAYKYLNDGNFLEAGKLAKDILKIQAKNHNALFICGVAVGRGGHYLASAELLSKACLLDPKNPDYIFNLGLTYNKLGYIILAKEAIEQAIELHPQKPEIYYDSLATAMLEMKLSEQNASFFEENIKRNPELSNYLRLAVFWYKLGKYSKVQEIYKQYIESNPSYVSRITFLQVLIPIIPESVEQIYQVRQFFEQQIDEIMASGEVFHDVSISYDTIYRKYINAPNFYLAYHNINGRKLYEKTYQLYAKCFPQLTYVSPLIAKKTPMVNRKIRLGFISKFLFGHSVSTCYGEIIKGLNNNPNFEVFAFTSVIMEDDKIKDLKATLQVIYLPDILDHAVKEITLYDLDILVYLDVGMDHFYYVLAMMRLAPIQCVMQGHPVTTGMKTIDYFISERAIESPNYQDYYTEKVLLLKHPASVIERPKLPELNLDKEFFGLEKYDKIILCPMMLQKIHPRFDTAIRDILTQIPNSVVVFFNSKREERNTGKLLIERFKTTIEGYNDRVMFLPWQEKDNFLELIKIADVVLDTFYFGGGTTSFLVLATGTPFVALMGDFFPTRILNSLYVKMGLTELIAESENQFVDIVVKLATCKEYNQEIRTQVLQENYRIYNEHAETLKEFNELFMDLAHGNISKYLSYKKNQEELNLLCKEV